MVWLTIKQGNPMGCPVFLLKLTLSALHEVFKEPEIGLNQHHHRLFFGCKIQGWLVVFVAVC
ncbi:hypothetical protein ACE1BH_16095, partial [Aeromonas jandaei]